MRKEEESETERKELSQKKRTKKEKKKRQKKKEGKVSANELVRAPSSWHREAVGCAGAKNNMSGAILALLQRLGPEALFWALLWPGNTWRQVHSAEKQLRCIK